MFFDFCYIILMDAKYCDLCVCVILVFTFYMLFKKENLRMIVYPTVMPNYKREQLPPRDPPARFDGWA